MKVFSLSAGDLFIAATVHNALVPTPAGPVPAPSPHVDAATLGWVCPWFEKLSADVRFDGWPAVQQGHDVGYGIGHVGLPTPLLATQIAFSGCKAMFGKSRVLVGGTPAAWFLPIAAGLHVCADPMPLPIGLVPTALSTTVKFGFAWDDLVAGMRDVVIDQLLSVAIRRMSQLGKPVSAGASNAKPPFARFLDRVAKKLTEATMGRTGWPASLPLTVAAEHGARVAATQAFLSATMDKAVRTKAKKLASPLARELREIIETRVERGLDRGVLDAMLVPGMMDAIPLLGGGL